MNNGVPSSTDMAALMGQLKKSQVGYQTPLAPFGGNPTNSISPLVPQQLAQTLSIATSSMSDLKLWPMLNKVQATNTVVEFNRVLKHGAEHSPFIAEGGSAPLNRSTYEKVNINIKYLAERRDVTDQSGMVNIVGPSPDAIAEATTRATESLLRRVEKELFYGDSSLNPLAWDGIIKQIRDGGNVADLRGAAPNALYLSEILGSLYSAPFYGMVSHILVTPRTLQELIKQTVHHGRHDQIQVSGGNVTFGAQSITITGPYGPVPVVACPFLEREDRIAPASGTSAVFEANTAVTAPTIAAGAGAAQSVATSKFVAADAGDYYYRVVPVGTAGVGEPVDTVAISVVAGDKVSFTINQTNTAQVDYYKIYRSKADAANADGALLVGEVKRTAAATLFEDNNESIPGASKMLFVNMAADHMCYYQMLSLVRRPLAQLGTSYPFLLMMFGAPAVKLPTKCFVVDNAGVNASQGLSAVTDPALLGLHI